MGLDANLPRELVPPRENYWQSNTVTLATERRSAVPVRTHLRHLRKIFDTSRQSFVFLQPEGESTSISARSAGRVLTKHLDYCLLCWRKLCSRVLGYVSSTCCGGAVDGIASNISLRVFHLRLVCRQGHVTLS